MFEQVKGIFAEEWYGNEDQTENTQETKSVPVLWFHPLELLNTLPRQSALLLCFY